MTTPDQPKDDARSTGAPRPTTEQSSREQAPQQGGPVKPAANPLPPRPLPPTGQRPAQPTQQGRTGPVRPSQSPPPPPVDRSQPPVAEAKPPAPSGSTTAAQTEKSEKPQQSSTLNIESPQQQKRPPTTSDRHVEGDDHLVTSHDAPPRRAEHPPTGQNPTAPPNAGTPAQAKNGGAPAPKAPPWQRGQQPQSPQNEPQSNLFRPGESPVAGRPPARPPRLTDSGQGAGGAPTAATTTAAGAAGVEAAKNARREAAKTKAAAIDGPTRKVARPELSKDMPDLSDVKHPLPDAGATQTKAAPTAVAASSQAAVAAPGEGLRATVQLRKIDPWSTLKVSLVISVALFFVWMVAVGLLYVVLDGMGVWDRLNSAFTDIVSESGSGGLISGGQVFGYAAVIGLINVVLFTALATIGSFIYNQCSDLVGGVQVTLADPD